MYPGRSPLRERSGVLHVFANPRTRKLTPEGLWALWALLAGIAVGLILERLG